MLTGISGRDGAQRRDDAINQGRVPDDGGRAVVGRHGHREGDIESCRSSVSLIRSVHFAGSAIKHVQARCQSTKAGSSQAVGKGLDHGPSDCTGWIQGFQRARASRALAGDGFAADGRRRALSTYRGQSARHRQARRVARSSRRQSRAPSRLIWRLPVARVPRQPGLLRDCLHKCGFCRDRSRSEAVRGPPRGLGETAVRHVHDRTDRRSPLVAAAC